VQLVCTVGRQMYMWVDNNTSVNGNAVRFSIDGIYYLLIILHGSCNPTQAASRKLPRILSYRSGTVVHLILSLECYTAMAFLPSACTQLAVRVHAWRCIKTANCSSRRWA
jgi:hypothetical protein